MKKDEFRRLAEDVANCHICEKMMTLPHIQNSECLLNDTHGLDTDRPYVNRWNLWQGDLDADIMVIGQDYGTKEEDDELIVQTSDPTSKRLVELLTEAFEWDSLFQKPLFFTNMANCYRKHNTSGGMHPGWLPICANKFMSRLIRIIQPKIIIVLGRVAFEALHCMEDLPVICLDHAEKGKDSYAEMITHRYEIDLDDSKIAVFPVYHPGSNSRMNRSKVQQRKDWNLIADYYEKVKQDEHKI